MSCLEGGREGGGDEELLYSPWHFPLYKLKFDPDNPMYFSQVWQYGHFTVFKVSKFLCFNKIFNKET